MTEPDTIATNAALPRGYGPAFEGVVLVPIESLKVFARNARTHSPDQIAAVRTSIANFGWTIPVLRDETGTIIAGHARVDAARELGLTEVPVLTVTDWTDEQKRAYVLADNKLTERGGWNWEMVSAELKDLQLKKFDLALSGFEAFELEPLLGATWEKPAATKRSGKEKDEPAADGDFAIVLTAEQHAEVQRAVSLVRSRTTGTVSDGECLKIIASAVQ